MSTQPKFPPEALPKEKLASPGAYRTWRERWVPFTTLLPAADPVVTTMMLATITDEARQKIDVDFARLVTVHEPLKLLSDLDTIFLQNQDLAGSVHQLINGMQLPCEGLEAYALRMRSLLRNVFTPEQTDKAALQKRLEQLQMVFFALLSEDRLKRILLRNLDMLVSMDDLITLGRSEDRVATLTRGADPTGRGLPSLSPQSSWERTNYFNTDDQLLHHKSDNHERQATSPTTTGFGSHCPSTTPSPQLSTAPQSEPPRPNAWEGRLRNNIMGRGSSCPNCGSYARHNWRYCSQLASNQRPTPAHLITVQPQPWEDPEDYAGEDYAGEDYAGEDYAGEDPEFYGFTQDDIPDQSALWPEAPVNTVYDDGPDLSTLGPESPVNTILTQSPGRHDGLPRVLFEIHGQPVSAILDTGSYYTLMSLQCATAVGAEKYLEVADPELHICGTEGTALDIVGHFDCEATIGSTNLHLMVHMVRNLRANLLLGFRDMCLHNIKLDPQNNSALVGGTVVPLMNDPMGPLHLQTSTTEASRTEKIASFDAPFMDGVSLSSVPRPDGSTPSDSSTDQLAQTEMVPSNDEISTGIIVESCQNETSSMPKVGAYCHGHIVVISAILWLISIIIITFKVKGITKMAPTTPDRWSLWIYSLMSAVLPLPRCPTANISGPGPPRRPTSMVASSSPFPTKITATNHGHLRTTINHAVYATEQPV